MAVYEFHMNMHDIRLKPRLLRSLIKDHLPDEKHPIPSPTELSNVVSTIKTHGLLSECFREPVDEKQMDKWKSTVDSWVDRLLLLVSSKMPDKCWAGICLLGVTCQECSVDRFLASYALWFQRLLSQIQQSPSDSHFVKVATCASLSDLFTRLGGFSTVKKDATSHAGKLIQPVLKLLTEDSSEAVLEGAVELLCTLIKKFPSSVHRHYDSAEAVIVSKIMSGKCSAIMLKKFANCLALLPKTRGDEESWSLMMQKILISINTHLSDALQGFEEEIKSREFVRLLVPPGKDPPPPLGGQLSVETSDQAANRSEQLLLSRVSTLMFCCCTMLTSAYPVQVTIPVRPLLALVRRVLLVDGSLTKESMPFMTVMQQEIICSELPGLQLNSLDLLTAIIKGVRSQLLPYAADVVRLLTGYFGKCALPALRIKVYSIMQILLTSMGVAGMALYLAQEVLSNAQNDLDSVSHGSVVVSSSAYSKPATYSLKQPGNRKRKHATTSGDHHSGAGMEVEVPRNKPITPISVQIAALRALEALLTAGGALRPDSWRAKVDSVLINVATNVCDGGWANEEKNSLLPSGEQTLTWADFQLAALHALLASLLSPARVRPPHLSQGLDLFRRGKQETGTKLAEFCAHALLALEVLIHPRALPLADSSNRGTFDEGFNGKFPDNVFSGFMQNRTPFSRGILGMDEPDPDDDLYESWLGNGEETEAPAKNTDQEMKDANEPSVKDVQLTNKDNLAEKRDGKEVEEEGNNNKFLKEPERNQVIESGEGGTSDDAVMVPTLRGGEIEITTNIVGVTDIDALNHNKGISIPSVPTGNEMGSSRGVISAIGDAAAGLSEGASLTTKPVPGKEKGILVVDDDSDLDSFPDIIIGDPDSD
ncbi:hypothetical protein BVC80_9097g108 [Macleaya cordata]|uniref:Pre-rRNA-processing protein RIX1 N-terminal domain-containing protein n=1 Tax=Macleaya cordata TaxID=56857 RepID=A0A200QEX3_MACCD|nr:hypothetical protein BVC80_9097g108 [Macleaya cordata]